jgi:hypothetical protein
MILYNYIQYAFRVQQKECANWRVWGYSNRRSIFFFVIKNKLFSMVIQYLQGFTNTECVGSRYSWLYGRCCSSCIIVREYVPPSLLRRSAGGHAFFYWKVTQKILNCEWIFCPRWGPYAPVQVWDVCTCSVSRAGWWNSNMRLMRASLGTERPKATPSFASTGVHSSRLFRC